MRAQTPNDLTLAKSERSNFGEFTKVEGVE
jgi:hypothetical protein